MNPDWDGRMKEQARAPKVAPEFVVKRFTVWRGTILEIGLPCPCGQSDAAKVRSEDGTEGFICKQWWDAHQ